MDRGFVDLGWNAALHLQRSKRYPKHEWTNVAEMLNNDGRYIIGDDGELIELNIEEKRKHDDSNP